jgi:hypothetical protein
LCKSVLRRARSLAFRIRSSRIKDSEKELRSCFGVIGNTPPCVCTDGSNVNTKGEASRKLYRDFGKLQENFQRKAIG